MAFLENYRSPRDLPEELPLFPLLGAILLPRATLPLNVFEPRYLSLVDDTLSGDRVIGIVQPVSQHGYSSENDIDDLIESPEGKTVALRQVGCVGRITSYQELDDGRLMITLTGIARFRIKTEVDTQEPYRIARPDYRGFEDDFVEGLGEDQVDREHLLKVLKAYLESNRMRADWSSILRASSELLINALSVMCPYGPEEKQALLEAETLEARAEVLVALAEMELASGNEGGGTLQ